MMTKTFLKAGKIIGKYGLPVAVAAFGAIVDKQKSDKIDKLTKAVEDLVEKNS